MLNKAYIDLGVLKENALAVKGKLKKGQKFCAVVKADAYGHGACECANALYPVCDCFAVAIAEEGVNLRLSGIDKDILVLVEPFLCDLPLAVHYGLTLTVCRPEVVKMINAESKRQSKKTKVHIKVDTGMNRQGVKTDAQLCDLLRRVKACDGVVLDGVYSHFANPGDELARNTALNKFLLAKERVKGYNKKVTAHISASGGFLAGCKQDMVRIGLLLYGYKPYASDVIGVNPVMRVVAPVVDNRIVYKGERALYGDCRAIKDETLTLVRYGYADGLFRKKIDGQFNNRCMDLTAVTLPNTGNEITVMDNADRLAREYGTISYEILCRAASRAEKIYIR